MSDQVRYESILESISGGFFAMNARYEITYWNRAAEMGTGLRAGDVLGRNVFDVFPNARDAVLGEKYRLAMETRTYQSFETSYRDERFEKWYDVRIYPAADGLSVFFQDITERTRDQQQKELLVAISGAVNGASYLDDLCQRTAENIAALFEIPAHLVCFYLYDPRGNVIRLVAPTMLDIDFPPDVVHQPVTAETPFFAAQAAFRKEAILTDRVSEGTVGRLFGGAFDGLPLRTLIAMPLLVQQDVQGVIEVLTIKEQQYAEHDLDILRVAANDMAIGLSRKRLIDELRLKNLELEAQTQKTLDASDTLKKFLAMFSHELRSPLNSIIGFSELLATQLGDLPPDTVQDFMKNIQASGRHLQQILNDILDLSRLEAGKLDLHIASYPVSYFEETVRRVLAGPIADKRIQLRCDFSPDIEELVVDQTRFKQILINLVSNAVKFSRAGGRSGCHLGARAVTTWCSPYATRGRGSARKRSPVFSKRSVRRQAAGNRTARGSGSGWQSPGSSWSSTGGASGWRASGGKAPQSRSKSRMVVDATSEQLMQAGMLLDALRRENWRKEDGEQPLALVIEDSAQAAELLRLYIESAGYRVEIARNGSDAVDMAKRLHPHVITLDLMLPGKDGWQVMKELKRHPLCKHIPVIIVSIVDEKNLGFSLGAVEYFVKPVNREELVQALDRVHILPTRDHHPPTVLVIDDDRAATDLIQVILENEGYRVLKAFEGKEGLDVALRERPDVVILDLLMPGMSGFAVAQQMKQVPATRNIPIIVLTSMDVDEDVQEQLGSYVSALVSKASFTKRDLLREITNVENARWP